MVDLSLRGDGRIDPSLEISILLINIVRTSDVIITTYSLMIIVVSSYRSCVSLLIVALQIPSVELNRCCRIIIYRFLP